MKKTLSILFLSTLSFVSAASAGVVWSDALPTTGDSYNVASGSVGNWTVASGNVDLLQKSGPFGGLCAGATSCIDLDGNTQGSITSGNVTLGPGTYVLTFDLLPDQRNANASATVSFGTLFPSTTYTTAPGVVTQTFTLTSATTAALIFASNTAGSAGDLVTGVSISTASAVPEPSSTLLMSLPLLAFGAFAFRRARS